MPVTSFVRLFRSGGGDGPHRKRESERGGPGMKDRRLFFSYFEAIKFLSFFFFTSFSFWKKSSSARSWESKEGSWLRRGDNHQSVRQSVGGGGGARVGLPSQLGCTYTPRDRHRAVDSNFERCTGMASIQISKKKTSVFPLSFSFFLSVSIPRLSFQGLSNSCDATPSPRLFLSRFSLVPRSEGLYLTSLPSFFFVFLVIRASSSMYRHTSEKGRSVQVFYCLSFSPSSPCSRLSVHMCRD